MMQVNDLSLHLDRARRHTRSLMIVRRYVRGEPIDDICARYAIGRSQVLRIVRDAGAPKRPKHFPEAVLNAVLRDYRAGFPVAEIADRNHVSQAYVSTQARKAELSRYGSRRAERSEAARGD
jgi:hypothetical protein